MESAADILLPQTPDKLRELMNFTMFKPPKIVPNCFLNDFIQVIDDEAKPHDEKRLFLSELMNDNPLDCIVSKVKVIQVPPSISGTVFW